MASTKLGIWIRENGGYITDDILLTGTSSSSSRGIVACKDIKTGTRLVVVPHKLLINRNTIIRSLNHHGDTYSHLYRLSSHQLIAWFLIHERESGKDSKFYPFIESLPSLHDFAQSHPLMYTEPQLSRLPASTRMMIQTKVKDCLDRDYAAVVVETGSNVIKSSDFIWAWLCVNTRCIYYEMGGTNKEDKMTLAPFIDMLNHGSSFTTTIVKPHIRGLVLGSCPTDITKVGQQVVLSYGAHSNEFLLSQYGFTLEKNPHDYLDISQTLLNILILQQESKQLLEQYGYWGGDYTMTPTNISFRTTIALCCLTDNITVAKRLILSGSGLDSDTASQCINCLLDILQKVIIESKEMVFENVSKNKDIANIHTGRLTIAESVKHQLITGEMQLV